MNCQDRLQRKGDEIGLGKMALREFNDGIAGEKSTEWNDCGIFRVVWSGESNLTPPFASGLTKLKVSLPC